MRPTGNCSPALVDLLTAFLPAVLPLPRPLMVAGRLKWLEKVGKRKGVAIHRGEWLL